MRIKKLITGKTYEVFWLDTYNFLGWQYQDDIDGMTIDTEFQSTLGYYVKEVKDWFVFAMHKNPNTELGFPEWGNIVYIPRKSTIKVKSL